MSAAPPSPISLADRVATPWWLGWVAVLAAGGTAASALAVASALGAGGLSAAVAVACAGLPTLASLVALRGRQWRLTTLAMTLISLSLGRMVVSVGAAVGLIHGLGLDRASFVWPFLAVAFAALAAEKAAGVWVLRSSLSGRTAGGLGR